MTRVRRINKRILPKKRLVFLSDFHGGHIYGLTKMDEGRFNPKLSKEGNGVRQIIYDNFVAALTVLRPVDIIVLNGDLIEGPGKFNNGAEVFQDLHTQCEMAAELILTACKLTKAKEVFTSYGTASHVSDLGMDYENLIRRFLIDAGIYCHQVEDENFISPYGVKVYARHHLPGAAKTRSAQVASLVREVENNASAAYWDNTVDLVGDVNVYSHQHKSVIVKVRDKVNMVTPSWQARSRFGHRRLGNHIDLGLSYIDVYETGKVFADHLLIDHREYPELLPNYKKPLPEDDELDRVYEKDLDINQTNIKKALEAKKKAYKDSIDPRKVGRVPLTTPGNNRGRKNRKQR